MTVFGQFTREMGADAAGGAGNESEGRGLLFMNGSELIKPEEGDGIPNSPRAPFYADGERAATRETALLHCTT